MTEADVQVSSPLVAEPSKLGSGTYSGLERRSVSLPGPQLLNAWLALVLISTAATIILSLFRPNSTLTLALVMFPHATSVLASARVILLLASRVGTPNVGMLNPYSIVVGIICTIYVARPLFVLKTGVLGSDGTSKQSLHGIEDEVATALAYSSAAIAFLCFGMVAGVFLFSRSSPNQLINTGVHPQSVFRIAFLGIFATLLVILVLQTIRSSERDFFGALTARQLTFETKMHLLWATEYFRLSVLTLIGARRSTGMRVGPWVSLLYLATICLDFLSGSRTELLLNNLLLGAALLILTSTRSNRLKKQHLVRFAGAITSLLFFIGFVAMRQYVRDERGQLDPSAIASSVLRIDEYILDSDEAAGFDYFVKIKSEFPSSHPYRGLDGMAAIAAAPIPSAVFPEKPDRAAVALTRVLAPHRVKHNANIAVSGFADLYSIWGFASLLIGSAIVGTLLGYCMNFASRFSEPYVRVIIAFAISLSLMDTIRSDVFSAALTPARLILVWLALKTVLHIQRHSPRKPLSRTEGSSNPNQLLQDRNVQ